MAPSEPREISAARTRKERLVLYILATLFAIAFLATVLGMLAHEAGRS